MANNNNNVQGPPPAGPNFPAPDLCLMEELLQAPTDGVGDAIVIPLILANQFELKIDLLNLLTAITFHGFSAAGGNFLTKNTQEALTIIENKYKVQTYLKKPQVLSASGSTTQDAAITALTKQVEALVSSMNRQINSIQNGCETCGGPHAYYECQATGGYTQDDVYATTGTYNVGGNSYQPQVNSITTKSGLTTAEPSIPPPIPPTPRVEVEKEPETLMDESYGCLKDKEKLEELANTPMNVKCSAILLNKVLEKLRDLRKFLIPYVLQDLEVCSSLADSGASINLMSLSIYEKLRIAEDVIVRVDKFNFLADSVIVDFEVDPRVPIILGRPFLRTAKALNLPSRECHSIHSINIIDSPYEEIFNQNKQSSGSTTSQYDLSLPDYEVFCFEEKSSGSTTSHSDHSLPEYESFFFDVDHIEEKSSGSTTSHFDLSLLEYDSFHFDLLIDQLPPADRSDSHHEEFADELAHIISSTEYDCFYFDVEPDLGELTIIFEENISEDSTKELTSHELNNFPFFLSDCDSIFFEKFSEIDLLVLFPS
ncbi:hypothetical protein Tco_1372171 [Tanacetum coccineum]